MEKHQDPFVDLRGLDPLLYFALVWCLIMTIGGDRKEWVDQLSAWALCGLSVVIAVRFWRQGVRYWIIPSVALAVIFNPLAPISFSREEWVYVHALSAAAFLFHLAAFRRVMRRMLID
jgi:hypothetical protein